MQGESAQLNEHARIGFLAVNRGYNVIRRSDVREGALRDFDYLLVGDPDQPV